MPTPSIQTLRADAQQVLNLDSISAVRSVVAATLANANTGTPLNPNLTTQQLWNEFYQIVTQPKSDIESIIANQLMKFLYAPPAPGGVGANGQVIFNDGGVLAGDPQFLWNKTTNLLTVTGSATITGDLTVDTNVLKVDSANDRVIVGHTSGSSAFQVTNAGAAGLEIQPTGFSSAPLILSYNRSSSAYTQLTLDGSTIVHALNGSTAMTLNSTGLGVGASPNAKLTVYGGGATTSTVNFSGGSAGTDNATIASNYNLTFQVDANNTIGGREFVWRYGGKGYGDGTLLMKLDASGNLLVGLATAGTTAAKTIQIADGTAPTANVTGGQLYVEAGALKYRGSSGTITTLANA